MFFLSFALNKMIQENLNRVNRIKVANTPYNLSRFSKHIKMVKNKIMIHLGQEFFVLFSM